jgi:hypothetical protein
MSSIYLKTGVYWYLRYVPNPKSGKIDKREYHCLKTDNRAEATVKQKHFDDKYDEMYKSKPPS